MAGAGGGVSCAVRSCKSNQTKCLNSSGGRTPTHLDLGKKKKQQRNNTKKRATANEKFTWPESHGKSWE